ncbi:hypothetical protein LTR05_002049 [Lithohypha guttulata]|uniref:Uncharacterized protein n=1 Tax=Lithohypha guttulata TaxID=1690604 RepID=A0AAN7T2V8_9EURO|nr:hypothetical protein LTR05_002049 [Lithohypha guttulata]
MNENAKSKKTKETKKRKEREHEIERAESGPPTRVAEATSNHATRANPTKVFEHAAAQELKDSSITDTSTKVRKKPNKQKERAPEHTPDKTTYPQSAVDSYVAQHITHDRMPIVNSNSTSRPQVKHRSSKKRRHAAIADDDLETPTTSIDDSQASDRASANKKQKKGKQKATPNNDDILDTGAMIETGDLLHQVTPKPASQLSHKDIDMTDAAAPPQASTPLPAVSLMPTTPIRSALKPPNSPSKSSGKSVRFADHFNHYHVIPARDVFDDTTLRDEPEEASKKKYRTFSELTREEQELELDEWEAEAHDLWKATILAVGAHSSPSTFPGNNVQSTNPPQSAQQTFIPQASSTSCFNNHGQPSRGSNQRTNSEIAASSAALTSTKHSACVVDPVTLAQTSTVIPRNGDGSGLRAEATSDGTGVNIPAWERRYLDRWRGRTNTTGGRHAYLQMYDVYQYRHGCSGLMDLNYGHVLDDGLAAVSTACLEKNISSNGAEQSGQASGLNMKTNLARREIYSPVDPRSVRPVTPPLVKWGSTKDRAIDLSTPEPKRLVQADIKKEEDFDEDSPATLTTLPPTTPALSRSGPAPRPENQPARDAIDRYIARRNVGLIRYPVAEPTPRPEAAFAQFKTIQDTAKAQVLDPLNNLASPTAASSVSQEPSLARVLRDDARALGTHTSRGIRNPTRDALWQKMAAHASAYAPNARPFNTLFDAPRAPAGVRDLLNTRITRIQPASYSRSNSAYNSSVRSLRPERGRYSQ